MGAKTLLLPLVLERQGRKLCLAFLVEESLHHGGEPRLVALAYAFEHARTGR